MDFKPRILFIYNDDNSRTKFMNGFLFSDFQSKSELNKFDVYEYKYYTLYTYKKTENHYVFCVGNRFSKVIIEESLFEVLTEDDKEDCLLPMINMFGSVGSYGIESFK